MLCIVRKMHIIRKFVSRMGNPAETRRIAVDQNTPLRPLTGNNLILLVKATSDFAVPASMGHKPITPEAAISWSF